MSKSKFINWLNNFSRNTLIVSALAGLLSIVGASTLYVYKDVQSKLDNFGNAISDLVYEDENAFVICKTLPNDEINGAIDFKYNTVLMLHNRIRVKLGILLQQQLALGVDTSYKTYLIPVKLANWNNALFNSGLNLCQMKLKNSYEMDRWRDKMLDQVEEDKKAHQRLGDVIKDTFYFFRSFFLVNRLDASNAYSSTDEDKIKINKY